MRYPTSLELSERAAKTLQRLPSRSPALRASVGIGLAEMCIRLGLYEQAAHVLKFTRRVVGSAELAVVNAWLNVTEATLRLRQGDTTSALRLATKGLTKAQAASDQHGMHLELLLLARIALEDGDVRSAHHLLEVECAALESASTAAGQAELAVLRAKLARAEGRGDALEVAEATLPPLREAGDEELLIEGLTLVALGYRDAGQPNVARQMVLRATAVRDRVADTLRGDIRDAYVAKRENTMLEQLLGMLEEEGTTRVVPYAPRPVAGKPGTPSLLGEAQEIASLRVSIRKVARSNSIVLVRGESGTGKELVAAALHAQSERANGPLVTVNCAALVETLLLSELFGHEKGAFTGAATRRRGRFELAEGGTLFLDEIGDIPPRTQVALLRVLQERTFERVGGATSIQANVRVVCATHRNLAAMVERGEFREDLCYRLCGIVLEVPALRHRLGDLPELARHLLERVSIERGGLVPTLSRDALELMARHTWPGNVRELENVLRSLALFCEGSVITSSDLVVHHECFADLACPRRSGLPVALAPRDRELPDGDSTEADDEVRLSTVTITHDGDEPGAATEAAYVHVRGGKSSLFELKRQIERDCIRLALEETGGHITRAAVLLGMKRPRLSQLVKQYQLQSDESCS